MNSNQTDDVSLATLQLTDGLKTCHSVVKNYRAMFTEVQTTKEVVEPHLESDQSNDAETSVISLR